MFGLLVKVVESSSIDMGSIPGSLQVRQKSDVGQKLKFLQICDFFKTWNFNLILKFAYFIASFGRFGVWQGHVMSNVRPVEALWLRLE